MYILKSLFYSLASLKLSDAELIRYALMDLPLKKIRCNACGQTGHMKLHSRYSRTCVHAVHGKPVADDVTIPIVRCSCGYFHAVLPDILIPFGVHSIRFVLTVLHAYYTRADQGLTVTTLCSRGHWDIAPSTLYAWKKRFEAHYAEWCRNCHRIRQLADAALSDVSSVPAFPEYFRRLCGHCFLQRCERFVSKRVSLITLLSAPPSAFQ